MNSRVMEDELGIQFCRRQTLSAERGLGCRVWDEEGREYLDFTSGWGVTCLGHAHPVILEALNRQAGKLMQNPNSGFSYSPVRARLLQELQAWLPPPLRRVYFLNSGAEANDLALKLARKLTGRDEIVTTRGAFHGRTYSTLKVSTDEDAAARFRPRRQNNRFVEFGSLAQIRETVSEQTAAVIVEPIQGEGGVRIPASDYLSQLQLHCQAMGALLIIDEIQTGFCRTGRRFALEYAEPQVRPDMMTMAKGIAGGFPFAAIAVSEAVADKIQVGDHGGTYCGNPLGCAVAVAVLHYLRTNNVAQTVLDRGRVLGGELKAIACRYPSLISALRGRGLLWALQLSDDSLVSRLAEDCLARCLLITPTRNGVLRIIPSLLVSEEEINEAIAILDAALACAVEAQGFGLDCGVQCQS